jgi:hypothetical protein
MMGCGRWLIAQGNRRCGYRDGKDCGVSRRSFMLSSRIMRIAWICAWANGKVTMFAFHALWIPLRG